MKIFTLLLLLASQSILSAQTWTWSSQAPVAGSDLTVTVTGLDIEEGSHVIGYYFQGNDLITSDINYIVDNGALKMTLKVPETNWIRLVVKDQDFDVVTGDHRDIMWAGAPPKSSLIDYANATAAYYRVMGLTRDEAQVTNMYREAVKANPKLLDNPHVQRLYYNMAKAAAAAEDMQMIESHILECGAQPAPSQDALISAIRLTKEKGDSVTYHALRKKLDETYPQSIINQEEQLALFMNASELADKIMLRDKFRSAYPVNDMNRGIHDQMTSALVEQCADMEEWEKVKLYVTEIVDPTAQASVCNNYAWALAGEGLEKDATNLDVASELSSKSIMLLKPEGKKPATMSQSEWERNLEFSKAMYGDTYALILYRQGKYDEAVDLQANAVKMYNYNDVEMNERYGIYLEKAGKKEELLSFTEEMIKLGKASSKLKSIHEDLWMNSMSREQLYDRYIVALEAEAKAKRFESIKSSWMDEAPVEFMLKDLDGKTVSLSDYKGKTVVLDFWATWCGPCKASFPGMKNAVQQYASDPDVVFLFVDTWEGGEGVHDKVKKFISDNNYPFHVLMDTENEVVTQYKVEGIPTKFVIGPDQRVRFKSIGFGGNNDVLVEEMMTMIEMARKTKS